MKTARHCIAVTAALLAAPAGPAAAADFYQGKQVTIVVGFTPGGTYDLTARLYARHIGRYLPGKPSVLVQNMPGAGSLVAAANLYNVAPKDGTTLGVVGGGTVIEPLVGTAQGKYDARRFTWIGGRTRDNFLCLVWQTAPVASIEDVKRREVVVGATGPGSRTMTFPKALNEIAGTKFKIVSGYPGGNDVNLAMERGEVGGRGSNSWASWKATHPQWLAEKKIYILVQIALKRHAELADVPTMMELAKNEEDRAVLAFLSADIPISRAYVTTPGTPADRVAALRRAFDATMKDPAFLAEAQKANVDVSPSTGEEAQKFSDLIANTPPAVIARAKAILDVK